jgi:hypothetical protein
MLNEGEHIDSSLSSHIVLIISWINHWSSIFYASDHHRNKRHKNINEHNPTSTSAQVSVLADSDSGGAAATSVVAASIDGYDYDDGHDYPTAGLEGGLNDMQSVEGEARQCMCSYLDLISHKTNIVYQVLTLIQAWPAPLQEQHLLRVSFQFPQPQQWLQPVLTHSRWSSTPTVVTLQLSRHFLLMGVDRKYIHPLLMIHLGTLLPVVRTLSLLSSHIKLHWTRTKRMSCWSSFGESQMVTQSSRSEHMQMLRLHGLGRLARWHQWEQCSFILPLYQVYMTMFNLYSSKNMLYPLITRSKPSSMKFIHGLCGIGQWTY